MRRKVDYEEEQNRESLNSGVKFFAVAGVAASLVGSLLGSRLLEYSGLAYLLITTALLLVLLSGYIQRPLADGHA
jgi:hypothetical protein